jgi:hypothetical protein
VIKFVEMRLLITLLIISLVACNSRQNQKEKVVYKQQIVKNDLDDKRSQLDNAERKISFFEEMAGLKLRQHLDHDGAMYMDSAKPFRYKKAELEASISLLEKEYQDLEFEIKKY